MSTRYFKYVSFCVDVIKENYHLNIYPVIQDKRVYKISFPHPEKIKQVKLIHERDKSIPRGIEPS